MRELGEQLKRRRLDREITLDDVQAATKIRLRYLTALEEGRFDVIPGEVYLKGFLRTYADYLGLDGLELLQTYQEMREQRYREAMQAEQREADGDAPDPTPAGDGDSSLDKVAPAAPAGVTPVGANDAVPMPSYRPLRPVQSKGSGRRWVWPVAVVGLVLAVFAVITVWVAGSGEPVLTVTGSGDGAVREEQAVQSEADQEERAGEPASEAVVSVAGAHESQPTASDVADTGAVARASERARTESINLEIRAREACWVRVLADGEQIYEGTMIAGDRRVWEANERLHIRLGNARGVDLILNGEELETPDQDVIEREFTPATVAQLHTP